MVKIRVLLLAIITTGPRYFGHAVADTQPSPLFTGVCIILMVHEANKYVIDQACSVWIESLLAKCHMFYIQLLHVSDKVSFHFIIQNVYKLVWNEVDSHNLSRFTAVYSNCNIYTLLINTCICH